MITKVRKEYDPNFSGYISGAPGNIVQRSDYKKFPAQNIKSGYVELVGPVSPRALKGLEQDTHAPETPQDQPKTKRKGEKAAVYEYSWCVGILGSSMDWYSDLDRYDPIVIQMIFHTGKSCFHIQEVAANLKQVPPYPRTKGEQIQDWVDLMRPVMDTTGKVLELTGLAPAGKIVSSISKMKLNSVPVDKFPWYIKTFCANSDEHITEAGVEWHIPGALIQYTGNRLSGSIGLIFTDGGAKASDSGAKEADISVKALDGEVKEANGGAKEAEMTKQLRIEAKAFLRLSDGTELFLSPTNGRLELTISPH